MKYLLIAILALSSCKKCYQCSTLVVSKYGGTDVRKTEFCGTRKEKKAYEAAGTIESFNGKIVTTCK